MVKNTLIVETARAVNSIVTLQQSACSALLRDFEPRNRDWEQFFFAEYIYNAFALKWSKKYNDIILFLGYTFLPDEKHCRCQRPGKHNPK